MVPPGLGCLAAHTPRTGDNHPADALPSSHFCDLPVLLRFTRPFVSYRKFVPLSTVVRIKKYPSWALCFCGLLIYLR
jgi:hypothetical protein